MSPQIARTGFNLCPPRNARRLRRPTRRRSVKTRFPSQRRSESLKRRRRASLSFLLLSNVKSFAIYAPPQSAALAEQPRPLASARSPIPVNEYSRVTHCSASPQRRRFRGPYSPPHRLSDANLIQRRFSDRRERRYPSPRSHHAHVGYPPSLKLKLPPAWARVPGDMCLPREHAGSRSSPHS